MTVSAEHFLPGAKTLDAHHTSLERLTLWVTRQNDLVRSHWSKITEVEGNCRDCRNDRRLVDSLVDEQLQTINKKLDELIHARQWVARIAMGILALSNLFLAAKTAGIFK